MAITPETPASEPAFDLRKLMGEFDPNKLMGQFQTMLTQFKLPSVDIDKLIAAQQKNIEAVAEANRVAVDGIQALAKRQVEVLQETMKEASQAVSPLSKTGLPAGPRRKRNLPRAHSRRRRDDARDGRDPGQVQPRGDQNDQRAHCRHSRGDPQPWVNGALAT